MIIHDDTYLRNLPKGQLEALESFLGWKVGSGMTVGELHREIAIILKQVSGVLIVTTRGETHHINPRQPIKEIYIDGKLVRGLQGKAINDA